MTKSKRIFLTGGTGFVGRPLVRLLEKNGHKLLLLTRSLGKYRRFFDARKTRLIKGDLSSFKTWSKIVSKFKPDIAIHLAWEGIPDFSPAMCVKNLKYGVDLYEFLGSISCKTVITTGSCWEYGDAKGKISENSPIRPHNAFVAAKDALHNLGLEITKINGQNFIWLRLFYVYGPGQKPSSLIPYLIDCVQKGIRPEIKDPNASHDFIFIDDVAEAISAIVNKRSLPSKIYNIGSGRLMSVGEVANLVFGKEIHNSTNNSKAGFYAGLAQIKKDTGWHPKTSFLGGIRSTRSYLINKQ